MSKRRNELDTFVYNPVPKDFIPFDGDRPIFPQEKESTNLLSRLIPENQMYMQNNLNFILNNLPVGGGQAHLQTMMNYQLFSQTSQEQSGGEREGRFPQDEPSHTSK